MKIIVIGHSLVLEENRKRWQCLAQLYPHLQIHLLVPESWEQNWFSQTKKWQTESQKNGNYSVHPVKTIRTGHWSKYRISNLATLFWEMRPDFIFVMQEEFTYCLLSAIFYRLLFCPRAKLLFFSWQNIEVACTHPLKKLLWWYVCHFTDGLLAGTEQIKAVFRKAHYPQPIFVQTEIGVDSQVFAADPKKRDVVRKQLRLASSDFTIGFAGRVVAEKGIEDLVTAIFALPQEIPWKFLIVGDGNLRPRIEKFFQERGIVQRLHFIPEVTVEEMPDFFRAMDCFVLPSRTTPLWREQFGLALAQAMLVGIPCIGSDSGAIPEVLGDSRFIFPEGDQVALKELILQIYQGQRPELAKAKCYTIEYLAESTYDILKFFTV